MQSANDSLAAPFLKNPIGQGYDVDIPVPRGQ